MNWPQIAIIGLFALTLGIQLARHGEQRRDKYNVLTALIAIGVEATILYYGGFWA